MWLPAEPYLDAAELLAALSRTDPVPTYLAGLPATDPGPTLPTTRAELDLQLDSARSTGFARDRGELHPAIHCIAIPWPPAPLPTSLACLGARAELDDAKALVERCLLAAARPGAEPQDVIAAASA